MKFSWIIVLHCQFNNMCKIMLCITMILQFIILAVSIFHMILQDLIPVFRILQDHTWFYKISHYLTRSHMNLQDLTWSYKILYDLTRSRMIWQDLAWSYKISHDLTRSLMILQDFIRSDIFIHRALHDLAISYKILDKILARSWVLLQFLAQNLHDRTRS